MGPFTTGGRFHTTTENPPGVLICTELRVIFNAGNQIVSSAPFGDIGLALDAYDITMGGGTAMLAGRNAEASTHTGQASA